jgi:hypothetical protein
MQSVSPEESKRDLLFEAGISSHARRSAGTPVGTTTIAVCDLL